MVLAMLLDTLPAMEGVVSSVDASDDNPDIVVAPAAGVDTIVAAAADATARTAAEGCCWCCCFSGGQHEHSPGKAVKRRRFGIIYSYIQFNMHILNTQKT